MTTDPIALMNAILAAAHAGAWPLVAALVVGAIVRLTKPDVRWAPNVPARWRPLVAIAAGAVVGACDAIVGGSSWQDAAKLAGGTAAAAILGHVLGIEVLRGGKELPVPGSTPAPEPAPAERGFAQLGALALVAAAAVLLAFGAPLLGCHAAPAPRTVEVAATVAANDVLPAMLATYDRETAAAVAAGTSRADAEARLDAVRRRWAPVWDAWRALVAADAAARSGALCRLAAVARDVAPIALPAGVCS